MTDKRHWFKNFEPIEKYCWGVTIADGHKLWVRGIGSIHVQSIINGLVTHEILENVLYIPLLSKNLVSISQLMDMDIAVAFLNNTCKMITQAGRGRLIYTGQREQLLWRLNITVKSPSSSLHVADSVDSGSTVSPISKADHILQRWHMRLGHASSATIKQMAQNKAALGFSIPSSAKLPFCLICVKGKQHRASFPEMTRDIMLDFLVNSFTPTFLVLFQFLVLAVISILLLLRMIIHVIIFFTL